MIQGLALGTGLKVAGVSTLEAIAFEVASKTQHKDALIAVASDARMGEIITSRFTLNRKMGLYFALKSKFVRPKWLLNS